MGDITNFSPGTMAFGWDARSLVIPDYTTLLSEVRKQDTVVAAQQEELRMQHQQIQSQRQEIDRLKQELLLQNASLQERVQKLESYVATQMKTASDVQTAATTATAGGLR